MIYLTGDTHGSQADTEKISNKNLRRNGIHLKEDDYLIILGDFGYPFLDVEAEQKKGTYRFWIDVLSKKQYTILWIDGNHDNFNFWEKQPVTEWHGGKVQVHPHASNILHLMRGEIYEIDGKTFFAFGGAASVDKQYRTENFDWWQQEEASYAEIENAFRNLERYRNRVDYILTHTIPRDVIKQIPQFDYKDIPCRTADFLNEVIGNVDYQMWFAGHFHMDAFLRNADMMLFYQAVKSLAECEKIRGNRAIAEARKTQQRFKQDDRVIM